MARKEVIHSLMSVAALLTSASALPMMPLSPGLMGFGGSMFGGHGNMAGSHIGASYNGGSASFNSKTNPGIAPTAYGASSVLNGVERFFSEVDDSLVEGLTATISPSYSSNNMGQHGAMGFGLSPFGAAGLMAGGYPGYAGAGGFGGMYGTASGIMGGMHGLGSMGGPQGDQLEAVIQVLKPANFVPTKALVVFTEPAPTSSTAQCPLGPILTEPLDSKKHDGLDAFGYGFAGASTMLGGYPPFAGPMGGQGGPVFGVVAEVAIQPGDNTFTLQGLGAFTKVHQLAGHGLSLCENAQIGLDGRPGCDGKVFGCVKLGFALEPEALVEVDPLP